MPEQYYPKHNSEDMTTSLESLPNELWLLFMSFLTPINLYRALIGLNNRINCLIATMTSHLVLDTSQCANNSIRFSDMRQLLEGKDYWSKYLLSLIDTVRLTGTLASDVFCDQYRSPIEVPSMNTSFSILFPSLRRLYVTEEAIDTRSLSRIFLPLSKSLRFFHFSAKRFSMSCYFDILDTFTKHELSLTSMAFEVKNGCIRDDDSYKNYEWKKMYWSNTVHLSLFIERSNDLFVLLDPHVLPCLTHLCVTFIQHYDRYIGNYSSMENAINITSYLRSFQICHMSLENLLRFLLYVHMPLLENLTMIEIYDNTLNYLNDFQQYFKLKKNMPGLHPSSLRFLLRFPGELVYQWEKNRSFEWPFENTNIDYCLDEISLPWKVYCHSQLQTPEKKYSLIIFTRSTLNYHRTVHNYSFAMNIKQTSSIKWTCNYRDNSQQIFDSLTQFITTKELEIDDWMGTSLQNDSAKQVVFSSCFNQLRLNALRSLTFFDTGNTEKFLLKSQLRSFLQLILSSVPQLVKLTINWECIMNFDSALANGQFAASPLVSLRHLHLLHFTGRGRLDLSKLIDISILSKSLPQLTSLWTSGRNIYPDENLAKLIASIVTHFEQLTEFIINKGSNYRHLGVRGIELLRSQKQYMENFLRNIDKLRDSNRTSITWNHFTEFRIWL
ncbi:unnamed protein product [Rotaria socialis]|uniref:F-box domain-containing protein n=2 Tax=Rotaria socialis TaxID=392032 RepID=A0A818QIZ4_9BILA|nr:unnamed protein product [Rotaria socialis]CAF3637222.1 unnamed protein product [Rotaria socialis]CAF4334040.1 unnamed protein product [Rotaria socialis]CAF4426959.1 unnamed protein product [Rotaria socialis]